MLPGSVRFVAKLIATVLVLWVSSGPATASAAEGEGWRWVRLPDMPRTVERPGVTLAPDGLVYAIGGDADAGPSQKAYALDAHQGTWHRLPDLHVPVTIDSAVTVGDWVHALTSRRTCCDMNRAYRPGDPFWARSLIRNGTGPNRAVASIGRVYKFDTSAAGAGYRTRAVAVDDTFPRSPIGNDEYVPSGDVNEQIAGRSRFSPVTGADGRIYLIGGRGSDGDRRVPVLEPRSGSWSRAADLPTARDEPVVALALDGRIFVMGGWIDGRASRVVEVYDPATDTWLRHPDMPVGRAGIGAATTREGWIVLIGATPGEAIDDPSRYQTAWAYVPSSPPAPSPTPTASAIPRPANWIELTPMLKPRRLFAAAADSDGRIWALNGDGPSLAPGSLESRDWAQYWSLMEHKGEGIGAALGSDGWIYVVGSSPASRPSEDQVVEAFHPPTFRKVRVADLPTPRTYLAVVADAAGRIYAIGGSSRVFNIGMNNALATVERYDPATGAWVRLPDMPTPRTSLAATLGPDGRIYAVGGHDPDTPEAGRAVEAFDPRTNAWTRETPLPQERWGHTAVTTRDGRIVVVGGWVPARLSIARDMLVLSPGDARRSGWVAYDGPSIPRWGHASALGPDGRVHVLGGWADGVYFDWNPGSTSVEAVALEDHGSAGPLIASPTPTATRTVIPTSTARPTSTASPGASAAATRVPSLTPKPSPTRVPAQAGTAASPASRVRFDANPQQVHTGGLTIARWSGLVLPAATDWVGLFRDGEPDDAHPAVRRHLGCSVTPTRAPQAGICALAPPGPGIYEMRLISGVSGAVLARAGPVTVTLAPARAEWKPRVVTLEAAPGATVPVRAAVVADRTVDHPVVRVNARDGLIAVDQASLPARLVAAVPHELRLTVTIPSGRVGQIATVQLLDETGRAAGSLTILARPKPTGRR